MTEFKLDLTRISVQIATQAEKIIENSIESNANSIARGLLANGKYDGKEGLAHEIVRKRVEEFILSEAFEKKVDQAIANVADEEISNAVRVLVNSKTRKHLFEATG